MNHEGEQGGGASLLALDAGGLAWEGKPGGQQLPTLPRDTAWRTVSAQITGWLDTTALDIAEPEQVQRRVEPAAPEASQAESAGGT